jgi:hypothetical protein
VRRQRGFDAKLALGYVVALTLFAVFAPRLYGIGGWLGAQSGALLFTLLMVVSIANLLVVRFLFLPGHARGELTSPPTLNYSSPMAIATFGLLVSLITGQGLLALPFGAIALIGLIVIAMYLRNSPATVAVS